MVSHGAYTAKELEPPERPTLASQQRDLEALLAQITETRRLMNDALVKMMRVRDRLREMVEGQP